MSKVIKRSTKREIANVSEEEDKVETTVRFSEEFAPGRFFVYSHFKGQDFIHIREYVVIGEKSYPSKKGACFTPIRLKALMNNFAEIDEQLKQQSAGASYKIHLGAGIYAAINGKFNGVNLRRYWVPENQLSVVPTKNGIFLPPSQWTSLKEKLNELIIAHPELFIVEECFHPNQIGMMDCRECLPFGWIIKSFNEQ